jgi:hypothetical protein
MDKINCICKLCKKRFNSTIELFSTCLACGHLYHEKCIEINSINKCLNCERKKTFVPENYLSKQSQFFINIQSAKKTPFRPSFIDYLRGLFRLPFLLYHLCLLTYDCYFGGCKEKAFDKFIDGFMYWLNIHVKTTNFDKLTSTKKIFICNHVGQHDLFLVHRFIKSTSVASKAILCTFIGRLMAKYTHPLIIERGVSNNNVDMIKTFMNNNNSIIIFPQAIFSQKDTITKYKKGGFTTNHTIQPILFKYKQDVSSMGIFFDMFCFERVDLEIKALDPITNNKGLSAEHFAEHVRIIMANEGGFMLSNIVSDDARG